MRLALDEAKRAGDVNEVPVGAVILDPDGEVLAKASNSPISRNDPTSHAEILALRQACKKLNNYRLPGCILVVTLEPCLMCLGALVHARVETVVYGAADPKTGAVTSRLEGFALPFLNHRPAVIHGVLEEECGALLRDFFRSRR